MVASLPNIRKLFIPDPGYTIFDCDLTGADAQVVAWEADDTELKAAFRAGLDVHAYNATTMLGATFSRLSEDDPVRKKLRKQQKQAVHSTNYGVSVPSLAQILGWTRYETEQWQKRWFSAHPAISRWHQRVANDLYTTRTIRNAFGYRRVYFDRPDGLLPQALAWSPQSTIAIVNLKASLALRRNIPVLQMLLQVHDSNVFQLPTAQVASLMPQVHKHLQVVVPFDDPLIVPWGVSYSTVSWGDCRDVEWSAFADEPGEVPA